MKSKNILITFILGMLSVLAFIPLIETTVEIICSYLEVFKISATKKVLVGNKEILDLQSELEPVGTSCIGFQYDDLEDYDEDDFEDKKKNKIGFQI